MELGSGGSQALFRHVQKAKALHEMCKNFSQGDP